MSKENLHLKNDLDEQEVNTMKANRSVWEANAKKFKSSNEVSWGDQNMMELEVRAIAPYIKDDMYILDAGCSNGFSTFKLSHQKDIKVEAFDYSDSSIKTALEMQEENDSANKICFKKGNILNIEHPDQTFDIVYNIRVVINLPNWRRQQEAIVEMHRVLKPNGLYLMSEAFEGSLAKLNDLRSLAGLDFLKAPEFNLYINESKLEDFVKPYFDIIEVERFSSIYYVASRFLRYLTLNKGACDSYDNPINNHFTQYNQTDQSGDFGVQKLYVLKKK